MLKHLSRRGWGGRGRFIRRRFASNKQAFFKQLVEFYLRASAQGRRPGDIAERLSNKSRGVIFHSAKRAAAAK